MLKSWHDTAWNDYLEWQTQDRKTLKRVNRLIRDIERNGYQTTGDPERPRGDLSGWWSVRIDEVNRLVFQIRGETLEIYACKGHYD
jgi:toxin YoeB